MSDTTLVKAEHPDSQGCMSRRNGKCVGHEIAEWLNSLGPDDAVFASGVYAPMAVYEGPPNRYVTNGEVRRYWLAFPTHITRA